MAHYYDDEAIKLYVSRAIADGPRGTQSRLAEHLDLPHATINKWAQRLHCPGHDYWPGIEAYFDWAPGTLAGVGGLAPALTSEVESAILRAGELGTDQRDILLRMYYVLTEASASQMAGSPRGRERPASVAV